MVTIIRAKTKPRTKEKQSKMWISDLVSVFTFANVSFSDNSFRATHYSAISNNGDWYLRAPWQESLAAAGSDRLGTSENGKTNTQHTGFAATWLCLPNARRRSVFGGWLQRRHYTRAENLNSRSRAEFKCRLNNEKWILDFGTTVATQIGVFRSHTKTNTLMDVFNRCLQVTTK